MIYLFHGSDVEKTRVKAFEWIAKARAKESNIAYMRMAREEITDSALEDAALSGGLFVSRMLILIDDPFPSARATNEDDGEEKIADSAFEYHIDALAASNNAIVVLAPKLTAQKMKKFAAKIKVEYKYDKPATHFDVRGFNSNLVNALADRSKERLWLEINRAILAGDSPEMLHGLLHWKARDLMAKGSRAWSLAEARKLSLSLIELLQNSRRGGLDLSLSLERFALSI